jgi:hypothetical protein
MFYNNKEQFDNEIKCSKPTINNPFMNYTIGDLLNNKIDKHSCNYDDVKTDIRNNFRKSIYTDSSDIWGQYISDRNFYTMPNTKLVNDQKELALWLLGNSGECKTYGKNCLKISDPQYHHGRLIYIDENNF